MTLLDVYPLFKAAHISAVVFLVGSLLINDRTLRAISQYPHNQQLRSLEVLLHVDRRVTTPALLFAWTFGILLAVTAGFFTSKWLIVKLIFVVSLSGLHGVQSGRIRRCIRDGTPAMPIRGAGIGIIIAMISVATLAVLKPF